MQGGHKTIHMDAYVDEGKQWTAGIEYNALGRETRRICSGGIINSFEYDTVGRPVLHEVNISDADSRKNRIIQDMNRYILKQCAGAGMIGM